MVSRRFPPPRITVYDKAFGRLGWIGDPISVAAVLRHNAVSTGELVVEDDHRMAGVLAAPGCRVTVEHRGELILSGLVEAAKFDGPTGTATFTVLGDWRFMQRVLGWPVPGNGIGNQGTAYHTVTGPAETVVKTIAAANFTRLGLPITAAPDLGRGGSMTASLRMHPLVDRLFPAVDEAGIGVTITQDGTNGLVLDCYESGAYGRRLTRESGALLSWSFTRSAPTVTRAVVGGQGEMTAREFSQRVDATAEADWGEVAEHFQDARDTDDPAVMNQRGDEAIAEGAAKTGLSVALSETDAFHYGGPDGMHVGDAVTVNINGTDVTDTLVECAVAWTREDGVTVTPNVGGWSDSPVRKLTDSVSKLLRSVRDLKAR